MVSDGDNRLRTDACYRSTVTLFGEKQESHPKFVEFLMANMTIPTASPTQQALTDVLGMPIPWPQSLPSICKAIRVGTCTTRCFLYYVS